MLAGAPRPSAAAPADGDAARSNQRVVVYVDHSQLLDKQMEEAADKSRMWMQEDVTKALEGEFGFDVVEDAGDEEIPTIIVRLGWVKYEDSIYHIELETQWPDHPPERIGAWDYNAYNNTVLISFVLDKLPAAIEQLAEGPTPEPDAEAEAGADDSSDHADEPVADTGDDVEPGPVVDEDKPAIIGPVGIAGIATAVGGLGITGVALGLAARDSTVTTDTMQEWDQTVREPTRGRVAWPAIGLGLAAAGITMVIVDLTVLRKRRQRAVSVVPSMGPSVVGTELRLRF